MLEMDQGRWQFTSHSSQNAMKDGRRGIFGCGREQAKANARGRRWPGSGGSREADFSAAPLTKSVIGFGRNDGSLFEWE